MINRSIKNMQLNQSFLYNALVALSILVFITSCTKNAPKEINLAGKWNFKIDSLDQGISQEWYNLSLTDSIKLPGSMAENGLGNDITLKTDWTANIWNDSAFYRQPEMARYREPDNLKFSFWLTPEKEYVGPAWYQKKINIPEEWKDKRILLNLERPHWETTLWVNQTKIGMQNRLGTAHVYDLSKANLVAGEHTLTLRIDNRVKEINVGHDAHSISDNTQTNWNGIVGDISLKATPKIYSDLVKITPDISQKQIILKLKIENESGQPKKVTLKLQAKGLSEGVIDCELQSKSIDLNAGSNELTITYLMGDNFALWDEFEPNTYQMVLELESETSTDITSVDFGMREFKVEEKHFTINGRPVFLRGTLECAIFPLTGYPSTNKEDWSRIYKIIKNHGINHIRFHSWCPPEAAFQAADEEGIYLQVEASVWTKVGDDDPVDKWLYDEAQDILDTYGNHPSFVMMASGNEPSGDNRTQYLIDFVDHFKEKDSTKVYTSSAGWPYVENADFHSTADPRIQHWNGNLNSIINKESPQTGFDHQKIIDSNTMPVVTHEMGQWCVFPNLKEMSKYTGVLKPKNFEIFKETLEENHMGQLADSLLLASGKLQTLCYKADIEAALRTKGFAGFQLLDLHDFPGQGTALVGVLDVFWDEKGYVKPEEFKAFSGQTVPLARLKQRIFQNKDTLTASVEIAHFGAEPLKNVTPQWELIQTNGSVFAKGTFDKKDIKIGNGIDLGKINVPLNTINKAQKLTLKVSVEQFANTWDLWVYPEKTEPIADAAIKVVEKLDNNTIAFLQNGGSVLLNPKKGSVAPEMGGDIAVGFSSIFWNSAWAVGQEPNTLGILCDPKHSALAEFPTEYHSNWQWWDAMKNSNAIILDDFSPDLKPIVRIVDDWFENRRLGLLFEVQVGKGKLLVSGIDLHTDLENRIEAQQLLYSLKKYMISDAFSPKQKVDISSIKQIYTSK